MQGDTRRAVYTNYGRPFKKYLNTYNVPGTFLDVAGGKIK